MNQKRIYFLAGLPRSGSTLLANILLQNPSIYVTSTFGILCILVQIRNEWDRVEAFRAHERNLNETLKRNVLKSMLCLEVILSIANAPNLLISVAAGASS